VETQKQTRRKEKLVNILFYIISCLGDPVVAAADFGAGTIQDRVRYVYMFCGLQKATCNVIAQLKLNFHFQ
jgi:hypothetical protein